MSKREQWILRNLTKRVLLIGDLPDVPEIQGERAVDLLKYQTKQEIEQSVNLKGLIRRGWVEIYKRKDDVLGETSTGDDAQRAISLAEEDQASSGGGGSSEVMIIRDQKDSTVTLAGGVFTFNAWRTRDLTTVQYNGIPGASLDVNQVTLPAGTYHIRAEMPARGIQGHKGRIFNVTDNESLLVGQDTHLTSGGQVDNAIVEGVFTFNSEKVIEFQHHSETNSTSSTGFGVFAINILASVEVPAVYTLVTIQKIG